MSRHRPDRRSYDSVPEHLRPAPRPDQPPPPAPHRSLPPRPQPTMHPRKVRFGVKLTSREGPVSAAWSAQRWMRLVEDLAPGDNLAEGLVYARLGQTRALEVRAGHVAAKVQGRMPQPWSVDIRLPVFTHEQWDRIVEALTHDARFMAGLLAGEVPANIEDVFAPLRLRLFPQEEQDLAVRCTCGHREQSGSGWCKHVCCAMALVAERLAGDTFLIFQLRGLGREDLLERLRQKRALATSARAGVAGERLVPAYSPRLPGLTPECFPQLDQSLADFWSAPAGAAPPDLALAPPEVSHPLLRRLGPSPFAGARFPLVGLLATCYDVISAAALRDAAPPEPPASEPGSNREAPEIPESQA